MMLMIRCTYIAFLLFCLTANGYAQDVIEITLEKTLELANARNLTIEQHQIKTKLAENQLLQNKEWWLPDLFIGTTLHHLNGSGLNTDGRIFSDIDRQSRWLGGSLSADFDFGKGIYGNKAAKHQLQNLFYKNQEEKNRIIQTIVERYYQLLVANAKYNLYESLQQNKSRIINQLEVQTEAGLRLKQDLLLAKSNFANLQIQSNKSRVQAMNASTDLAQLLFIDPYSKLVPIDSILVPIALVNMDDIDESNLTNHPSLKSAETNMKAIKAKRNAVQKGLFIPDARVDYTLGPFGETYSDNQFTNSWNATVGWKIPLAQIVYGSEVKSLNSELELQQLSLNAKQFEMTSMAEHYRKDLVALQQQTTLANESASMASEALRLATERRDAGVGKGFEVIQAQQIFIDAKIQYLESIAAYNTQQYRLYVALGNDL